MRCSAVRGWLCQLVIRLPACMLWKWVGTPAGPTVPSIRSALLGLSTLPSGHPPTPTRPPTHLPRSEGKSLLYTAAAGVPPHQILPVTLDVGTNNQALLDDPSYGGLRQRRVVGEQYDALVEEFIQALKAWQPHVLLQFEVRRLRSVGARLGSETHAAVDASLLA